MNQLKGGMQESEMRASAAENRVVMLQKQIRDLEKAKIEQPPIQNDDAAKVDHAAVDEIEKDLDNEMMANHWMSSEMGSLKYS
jgi:cell fate (sporulation/competence/biofilm development) regulator YmcA (YheA/YmcA/DUF963 family)